ncbi:hypothetical protein D6D13_10647 [Aureobasidium pullulans]|uniref:Uncharacterized protein n=1 Tax=Aureobasidium pullulans TaxID=5580 RepID=A0A4S9BWM5_AURPU|nr:hypothetical protein D6D13_10647 [Aureobasidium pullulans]
MATGDFGVVQDSRAVSADVVFNSNIAATERVVNYEKEEEEEALQRMVDDKKRQYLGKQIVVYCSKI